MMGEDELQERLARIRAAEQDRISRAAKVKMPWLRPEGDVLEDYILGQKCGSGAFSIVKEAFNMEDGSEVVIKSPNSTVFKDLPPELVKEVFEKEGQIIAKADHPNLVCNAGYSPFMFGGFTHIVMENLEERLEDYLGTPPADTRLQGDYLMRFTRFLFSAVNALDYLHNTMGIVHCDLSRKQFRLDSSRKIKLFDFSVSKDVGESFGERKIAYQRAYFPHHEGVTEAHPFVDWYSLGKICMSYLLPLAGVSDIDEKMEILQDESDKDIKQILKTCPFNIPYSLVHNVIEPMIAARHGSKYFAQHMREQIDFIYTTEKQLKEKSRRTPKVRNLFDSVYQEKAV